MSCTGEEEGGWVCPCVEGALILWERGGGSQKNFLKKGSDDAIWQWAFTAPQICTNSTTQKYIIKSKVEENNSPFFVNVVLNRFCCFLVFFQWSLTTVSHTYQQPRLVCLLFGNTGLGRGAYKCVGTGLTFWIWRRDANQEVPKKTTGNQKSSERLCADKWQWKQTPRFDSSKERQL